MDLFVMNRFTTEESDKNEVSENEAKILAKLNARLKKRELEQSSTNTYIQHEETETNDTEKPKKKKRKKDKTSNIEAGDVVATEKQTEDANIQEEGICLEPTENVESSEPTEEEPTEKPIDEEQVEEEPIGAGFTVLEEMKTEKLGKIHRVLPNWLAKPSVISCDLSTNKLPVKEMKGLDRFITDALKKNKIQNFFPGFYQFDLFIVFNVF